MGRQIDLRDVDLEADTLGGHDDVASLIRDKVIAVAGAEGLTFQNEGLVEAIGDRVKDEVAWILRELKGKGSLRSALEGLTSSNLDGLEQFDAAYSEYVAVFKGMAVPIDEFFRQNEIYKRWQLLKTKGFVAGLSGQLSFAWESINTDIEVRPGQRFFHHFVAGDDDFAKGYWAHSEVRSNRQDRCKGTKLVVKGINADCTVDVNYYVGSRVVKSFSKVDPKFLTPINSSAASSAA